MSIEKITGKPDRHHLSIRRAAEQEASAILKALCENKGRLSLDEQSAITTAGTKLISLAAIASVRADD